MREGGDLMKDIGLFVGHNTMYPGAGANIYMPLVVFHRPGPYTGRLKIW